MVNRTIIFALLGVVFTICATSLANARTLEYVPVCQAHDELLPHPDCTLYYQCVNYVPTERACAQPLYFNPRRNECDFPVEVPECVGGTRPPIGEPTTPIPTEPSTQRPTEAPTEHPTTQSPTEPPTEPPTTQSPTEPSTEPPTTQSPTEPPTEPPTTQSPTEPPTEPPTTQSPTEPPTEPPTTQSPTEPPTESPTTQPEQTTTQEPEPTPTTDAPEITTEASLCHPAGYYTLPIPGNCTAFIICAYGNQYIDVCAEGLKFDPVVRKCLLEEYVDCFDATPPPEPTTEAPTTTEAPICTQPGYYLKPFPGSCTLYYACTDYTPTLLECGWGLVFDPYVLNCVRAENSNCTVPTKPPLTEGPTTLAPVDPTTSQPEDPSTAQPEDPSTAQPEDPTTSQPEDPSTAQPEDPTTSQPEDPTTAQPEDPSTAQPEDPTTAQPEDPTTAQPEDPTTEQDVTVQPTTTTTTTPRPGRCDPDRYYYIPYEGDTTCVYYIHCNYGSPILLSCAEGTLFNPDEQKCVRAENYQCPYSTTRPPTTTEAEEQTTVAPPEPTTVAPPEPTTQERFPCPAGVPLIYLPHDESCNLFYLCTNGEFRGIFTCGNSHWFDSRSQACVNPIDSDCTLEALP